MTPPKVRHLTPGELAEREGVSPETVKYWRKTGKGPRFIHFGKLVRYPIAEVEKWERTLLRATA